MYAAPNSLQSRPKLPAAKMRDYAEGKLRDSSGAPIKKRQPEAASNDFFMLPLPPELPFLLSQARYLPSQELRKGPLSLPS